MTAITEGDVVQVSDWPRVTGKRFVVTRITDKNVYGFDPRAREKGTRVFPKANCRVDSKATAARKARESVA